MTLKQPLRWLAAFVAVHGLLGLLYLWATPIFEASDEGAHYAVVEWLADGQPLPVQAPAGPRRDWAQEGSQPPLYYWLSAGLIRGVERSDYETLFVHFPLSAIGVPGTAHNANLFRHPMAAPPLAGTTLAVYIVRLFSLVVSAVTIVLTYQLARQVFRGDSAVGLLAAALVSFNPMALFINASVNNDNLLMLLSTLALVFMLALLAPDIGARARWRLSSGLAVALGLAALTKISGLVLWPLAGLALVWGEWLTAGSGGRPALAPASRVWQLAARLGWVFGLALLISGWWYWRNYQLYGEWLGLNTMVAIAGPRPATALLELVRSEWYGFYLSYWGVFGAFTVLPAPWVHTFYAGLTLAAAAGGGLTVLRRPPRLAPGPVLLALFCLLTLAGVINWTRQTHASQGRLLFGAIAPISIFMAAGLLALARPGLRLRAGRGWARGFVLTLAAALALVATVIPPAYIAPRYAPPPRLAANDLPPDLRPVRTVFAEQIELVGYVAQAEPVAPGDALSVTLYWRGLRPMAFDYSLALHVLGRGQSAEVGKLDTWPGGGNAPTSQWRPGVIYADTYHLSVAAAAEVPSLLWLDLYFWDANGRDRLAAVTPDGARTDTVKLQLGRAVPRDKPGLQPAQTAVTRFENGITLLGYDAAADGALHLTLYWQFEGSEPIAQDYTVFLHLTDETGVLLREPADAPPLAGDWPTSAWLPGWVVADPHLLALPPNLPAGRYNLRLGLYDPQTGVRLAAYQPGDLPWPENAMVIEGIVVR